MISDVVKEITLHMSTQYFLYVKLDEKLVLENILMNQKEIKVTPFYLINLIKYM